MISYGLNDARGGTPVALFVEELQGLVSRVREKVQPLIVLLGPYYMTGFNLSAPHWNKGNLEVFQEYNVATQRIADQAQCLFVDLLAAYGGADWLVHHDGCHANNLGHRVVANKIFEVLASNCSGLALEARALEKKIPPWRDETTLQADYGY